MELSRIRTADDERMKKLATLYQEAFPKSERREIAQLNELIEHNSEMYFNAIEEDGTLAGLFIYWKFEDFYYLEHLAVYAEMRNRKIGQQVLDFVARHLPGERLLEVEHATDELTTRRVNYYRRNGYEIVDRKYLQPSYDTPEESYPLWIMSNTPDTDKEKLARQIQTIKEEVYYKHYRQIVDCKF